MKPHWLERHHSREDILILVTLVYFLFTGQNEEAKNVLSPFVVILFFIVWTMMARLGEKR